MAEQSGGSETTCTLARAQTFAVEDLDARGVTVEVDIGRGLPDFRIVGLGDAGVREARDRVRAAIRNSGFHFPEARVTVNLAPADLRKAGPAFDLAIACGVLAASGQLPAAALDGVALFGELGLDGAVRSCRGTLAAAQAADRAGARMLLLGSERAREAMLIEALNVTVAGTLASAARVLCGGPGDPLPAQAETPATGRCGDGLDLADVYGQRTAVEALVVAAAGAHNVLLCGAPGTGKTMLAQRLPSILPPLSDDEAVEVLRIRSLAGDRIPHRLEHVRPFRAPHHSVTTAGLIGGAGKGWVGEVVLAHRGVLFLDEIAEFQRPALEALRQPLEDGNVVISRARHTASYPARFMLVAASNPCPCGYAEVPGRCRCSATTRARYARRLSGPLLDRIDLFPRVGHGAPEMERGAAATSSARAREMVLTARERQAARLAGEGAAVNAQMDVPMLRRHVAIDERGREIMDAARRRGLLSVRAEHRALRVARTVADLAGSDRVRAAHVAKALSLGAAGGIEA